MQAKALAFLRDAASGRLVDVLKQVDGFVPLDKLPVNWMFHVKRTVTRARRDDLEYVDVFKYLFRIRGSALVRDIEKNGPCRRFLADRTIPPRGKIIVGCCC